MRLVNGTSDMEGRIEICFDEAWGTICDNLWTTNDGNVACRQLGFSQIGLFLSIYYTALNKLLAH